MERHEAVQTLNAVMDQIKNECKNEEVNNGDNPVLSE